MKTSHKIILGGAIVFFSGIFLMLYEVYDKSFKIGGIDEVFLLVGLTSAGLVTSGVGIMLEFAKMKYGTRQ